jgi:esterase/lipase
MFGIDDWILTKFFLWKKFDSRSNLKIKRRIAGNKKSKKAIFFFPYWTGNSNLYKKLSKDFEDYTHVFYDYPNEIFSRNIRVSNKYNREVLLDAFNLVLSLREKGYTEINAIGSSSGSNFALKLSTMVKLEKVVLNMIDKNMAQGIFESSALKSLRKKLEKKGITQQMVDKAYSFISTDYLLRDIQKSKSKYLVLLSKNDIFCPSKEFEPLLKLMDEKEVDYSLKKNNILGHILGIYWNIFVSKKIQKFILDKK